MSRSSGRLVMMNPVKQLIPALILALSTAAPLPAEQSYDLIIRGGRIVDGTGNRWHIADVGIKGGYIAAVGSLGPSQRCNAERTIEAAGLIVAPGFIDVHTHADSSIRRIPTADNFVFDGVTSVIGGNCGGSPSDLETFFSELREKGISINFGALIGHGTLRSAVIGLERREPTPEELTRMEAAVERAMRQGAFGLSTGLIYPPGSWAKTAEIIALARVAARFNGIYATHLRGEGNDEGAGIFDAISEAIEVGREAGLPVQISHFKVVGKRIWGQSSRTVAMIEKARAAGLDVTVDQYPYTAASTSLGILLPAWAQEGGERYIQRLSDPGTRGRMVQEISQQVRNRGFDQLDYVVIAHCAWDSSLQGKSVAEINRAKGREEKLEAQVETLLDILASGSALAVYHAMAENDVEHILRFRYSMVASDGELVEFGTGLPHPRSYGTNARVLARYVREKKTLRLEEAIRKMTSLPAQRFRLNDRGLIRPSMRADLVIFDENTVADLGTYEKPHAYPAGFRWVIVNGTVVVEEAKHTGARPGQILVGPGAAHE